MGVDVVSACAFYDAGSRIFLWRSGSKEKYSFGVNAVLYVDVVDHDSMGGDWL